MKKLLLLLGLSFIPLHADDIVPNVIGPFGTLNNYDSSMIIPSDKAQDLLNVDITPSGKSVKKRKGFATTFTLAISTSATHGVYDFYDVNGNEVSLFFNDTRLSVSVNGGSPSVLFSTGSLNATYQCVDSAGLAYCANTSRTSLLRINASSAYPVQTVNSTGTIVAVSPDRLALSGFSEAPNRIDFSKSATFGSWYPPFSAGTDPNQITITAPGSRIVHITYAFDRWIWFKDNSFGYILVGTNLADWTIRTISPSIGTLDNSSVYKFGILYFRGQDGHFYSFDGTNVIRMSRDITATINTAQTRINAKWTQTSQADFSAGLLTPNVYTDTITTPGSLQLTFPDNFDVYRSTNPNSGYKPVWGEYIGGGLPPACTFNASAGLLNIVNPGSSIGACAVYTSELLGDFKRGTTYHVVLNSLPSDAASGSRFIFSLQPVKTVSPTTTPGNSQVAYMFFLSTTSGRVYMNSSLIQTNVISTSYDFSLPMSLDLYLSTTAFAITVNDIFVSSGAHTSTTGPEYAYIAYQRLTAGSGTMKVDSFGVAPETVTWQSTLNNAPNITSWDSFTANKLDNNGTHSFFIRASSTSIGINSSTPAWTSITPGLAPSISTNPYMQVRDDIFIGTWTATPQLNDTTINWFEGQAADKAYGGYYDNGIWWNVQLGTTNAYNNYVIRYDMLNNGFVLYDIPMNGFYVKNNSLYFGSSSSGTICKFGDVDNDNTSAINSYWKSKDFFSDSPFLDKEIGQMSISTTKNNGSILNVYYTLSGSTTSTGYSFSMSSNNSFLKNNRNIPGGKTGSTFNVKFGNNAADQPFEVNSIMVGTRSKPWNVTP